MKIVCYQVRVYSLQYHRTYDKNLTHDANHDLVYQLYQKQARAAHIASKPVKSLTVSPEMKRATWGYGCRSVDGGKLTAAA